MTPEEEARFKKALSAQSNSELEKYFDQMLPKTSKAIEQAAAATGNEDA